MKNIYKKFSNYIFVFFILLAIGLLINYNFKSSNVNVNFQTDFRMKKIYRGFKGAVDLVYDNKNTYFVAFKDKIQIINSNGWSKLLFKKSHLNINSIEYKDGILYYASSTKVYSYDLKTKEEKILLKEIPNYGDYKKSILKIKGDYLYVTIGAATNSGVVGKDNKWIEEYPHIHDITPKSITIRGNNFGKEQTGAFVPYKTKNIRGQILTSSFPGNSSVIIYNLKTGGKETFAWGIRNIKGIDYNSEEKIYATVGGMENRGYRPIKGDVDYIFEIKKSQWYGWPDYSGGDPVTSPRFKGKIGFLLHKHPTTNPPAPFIQNKNLGTLGELVIDREGVLGEKDSIFFYESKDNIIYEGNKNKIIKPRIKLPKGSEVSSLKFCKGSLIILDRKSGNIYSITRK